MLLITWKNGRALKPYGLNRLENYNMKFAFPCIVIIISCSVCASGELGIYPGLKFDLSSEEQRHSLDSADDGPSLYGEPYQRWPWQQNVPVDDYGDGGHRKAQQDFDFAQAEQLRTLEELLSRKRNRLKIKDELPYYYDPRYEEARAEYRNLEKNRKFDHYNSRYPNAQILDDVRPYPQEDDFTFGEEDEGGEEGEGEEEADEEVVPQRFDKAPKYVGSHHEMKPLLREEAMLGMERSAEEASGRGALLENAKFVEDPTQFAYPPSDSRFFQTTEINGGQQIPLVKAEKLEDNKILLSHRSDEKFQDVMLSDMNEDQKSSGSGGSHVEVVAVRPQLHNAESAGVYIIAVVAGISAAATVGLIAVGIGWYNLQKHVKSASDVEYPAYGVTGPNKDASPSGDRRLAQSAQMYHYQHQKQQIIAMESRAAAGDRHGSVSEADSDEENEEGDYTVYECPGLAPTGEMEVKNPLFHDDPTPAQTPPVRPNGEEKK